MTLEERLAWLERMLTPTVPGTQLARVLPEKDGEPMRWCLGLGRMLGRKKFFYGPTIEACLDKAEKWVFKQMVGGDVGEM